MVNTEYSPASEGVTALNELSPPSVKDGIVAKLLVLIVAMLMCIGIVVVYSSGAGWAATKYSSSEYFLWRQLIFSLLGIGTVLLVAQLDYHVFWKTSKIILFTSIVLLTLLLAMKAVGLISGAARWIGFGPLKFQVSDFAKYAVIFHF
jgi:cell division protein FtsW